MNRVLDLFRICGIFIVLLPAENAVAVPTVQVSGVVQGPNIQWQIAFTPDPLLLEAGNRAMAVEFSIELLDPLAGEPVVDPQWREDIDGTLIVNPGTNPYTGEITEGVAVHSNVASQLGFGGNVNSLFAALGSTLFTAPGEKLALTFQTEGPGVGGLRFSGVMAQEDSAPLVPFSGLLEIIAVDPPLPGDANNDGAATGADLGAVTANFGITLPEERQHGLFVARSPVPEPRSVVIAVAWLLSYLLARRRLVTLH